ncbi:hypothetical protein B0H63DRAFT_466504 [Podospora didyma]|uniref:Secreted protein n=1 Tax=Podospora didyma TaxID=330526 RepID=A0AAE0NZY0_9PEZI|nr:hypothetical protein B0H63DRAFT_466504 [Podospora didyma]
MMVDCWLIAAMACCCFWFLSVWALSVAGVTTPLSTAAPLLSREPPPPTKRLKHNLMRRPIHMATNRRDLPRVLSSLNLRNAEPTQILFS